MAVDFEPEALIRELPLLGRRSRLLALRQVADLNVPGTGAGQLLDEVSEAIGRANASTDRGTVTEELRNARRALDRLAALPLAQLTKTGAHLAEELRREWVSLHG